MATDGKIVGCDGFCIVGFELGSFDFDVGRAVSIEVARLGELLGACEVLCDSGNVVFVPVDVTPLLLLDVTAVALPLPFDTDGPSDSVGIA